MHTKGRQLFSRSKSHEFCHNNSMSPSLAFIVFSKQSFAVYGLVFNLNIPQSSDSLVSLLSIRIYKEMVSTCIFMGFDIFLRK